MATHSSVLAWRIPGTGEPGGLPSMGSHRVRHDWCDLAAAATEAEKQKKQNVHVFVCVRACMYVSTEIYFKELVHMIMHNDISKILGHPKLIGHQFGAAAVATEG